MITRLPLTLCLAAMLVSPAVVIAADSKAAARPVQDFNGTWSVALACDDFKPMTGDPVKGYAYEFSATIKDGALQAQRGQPGTPASVTYTGTVEPGGRVSIQAKGITGEQEFADGKVGAGKAYSYSMRGRLDLSQGTASRMELRPCKATFTRR